MITLLMLSRLLGPIPFGGNGIKPVTPFVRIMPRDAANCDERLHGQASRFKELERRFPVDTRAFRKALRWKLVEDKRVRESKQLVGTPRRHPSFFVVMPVHPAENSPAMVINLRPNQPKLITLLHYEADKLGLNGEMFGQLRQWPVEADGIKFERHSLDLVFFDIKGQSTPGVQIGMKLATALAERLGWDGPTFYDLITKQHGDLGREFSDAFQWTNAMNEDKTMMFTGTPRDPDLQRFVSVQLKQNKDTDETDLYLKVTMAHPHALLAMSDAFGEVQLVRRFDTTWELPPTIRLVSDTEPAKTCHAYFPGLAERDRADLKDGLIVTMNTLREFRRLLNETGAK